MTERLDPHRASAKPLGNTSLTRFDALIIGSGAGGSAVAAVLTRHGKNVLILEAGPNYFRGLDSHDTGSIAPVITMDSLAFTRRSLLMPDVLIEPRTWRSPDDTQDRTHIGEVNSVAQTVGGSAVHANFLTPRFAPIDFKLGVVQKHYSGTTFADWPVDYDMLEPFYGEMEAVIGVQGDASFHWWEGKRSKPLPMPPGVSMYAGAKIFDAAKKLGYRPFPYPGAVNSRPYRGRPPCTSCGFCNEYMCMNSARGSPAVTTLRDALLTGRCLVLPETKVVRLQTDSSKKNITGVDAIAPDGTRVTYHADQYVLAANTIESARLLFLSDPGGAGIGNSSGMVGRNLTFHLQNFVVGIFEERLHGHRGRTITQGMADFRGEPGNPDKPIGGIVEFGAASDAMEEIMDYWQHLGLSGHFLKSAMRESPLRDRLLVLTMHGEDAPQYANRVDLDPSIKDLDGLPVARVTYKNHDFELDARNFYSHKMIEIVNAAGALTSFLTPKDPIPKTRHVLGTLRMGTDPKTSVCGPSGRFHDVGNLIAADGSLFPTSSGFNPTLTIMALATRVGGEMVYPGSPERALL